MRSRAAGFTIVELLVVIAIIGTLAGLLLPAVQAARESGRRASCKNNVSQIAKAIIQFETQMGAFPSGGWGNLWLPSPNRGGELKQTGGWTFGILPFLEQMPLRDLIERATAANAAASYTSALATPIPAFACPSRRTSQPAPTRNQTFRSGPALSLSIPMATRADYAANGGKGAACPPLYVLRGVGGAGATQKPTFCSNPDTSPTPVSDKDVTTILIGNTYNLANDHLGNCGDCNKAVAADGDSPLDAAAGDAKAAASLGSKLVLGSNYIPDFQDGLVYRMSRIVPAKVTDGMSNTYLLAEKYVPANGYTENGDRGDDPLLAGFGSHNVRWAYDQPANDRDEFVTQTGPRANSMGSAHAGTFTVAYADGSVQEISTAVDLSVHRGLASRADGQTVERP
jgi:prepilin-type N-terminal cleavage/methylation domain-containing protein/prepilin-type processing-associated H-X9-DG protein